MNKKTDAECMIDAIMKDDADTASKKLEAIIQRKCAKKIKDVLSSDDK